VRFVIIVLAIVIPIRIFIAQPFVVNGESMQPTFDNGDYLIIDEISYRFNEPQRGDVVVFRFPQNHRRFLIKRVIGLPNETIRIQNENIFVDQQDGATFELTEEYIKGDFSSNGQWQLGDNEYFVLGDNRNNSSDSRSWGVLDRDLVIGKTFVRLYPLSEIELYPGTLDPSELETTLLSE
jgi:signal peptidase I